ncbi:3051_t:CDS:1, partial [Dentiscutata erythropus]
EKALWRKRFIKCLEKIADDDAYNEFQRKKASRLKEKYFSVYFFFQNGQDSTMQPKDGSAPS